MANRPNIIWIILEDVSPRFGCYGDALARTPNVDGLAADGRVYENAFCTAGVCAPSRASMMTGRYPPALGAHHMRTTHQAGAACDAALDAELPTGYESVPPHYVTAVSEHLRDAGYYATLDSKTDYQFGEPFTMWDHHGDGAGWWDADRDPDQPFFAVMTNDVTHESGMWPPDDAGNTSPETDPQAVDVPPYLPDTEPTRRAIARHYDNLERSDAWVGDLLDRLDSDGHADNTIVFLCADHGEGLPRKKRWPYDSGTHVPLIVRWPGTLAAGSSSDRLVSLVDLAPSALSVAGVDVPPYVQGCPFIGAESPEREYVFSTRDRADEAYDMIRSVRGEHYRYVQHFFPERPYVGWIPYRNRHPAMKELLRLDAEGELDDVQRQWMDGSRPAEELYDLRTDPHEVENLADSPDHRDVLNRFRNALDDWRDRVGDRRAAAEAEAEMRNRMWPDGEQPTTATPTFVPNAPGNRGRKPANDGEKLQDPAIVTIYCPTQGASIGYTAESGDDPQWQLYNGPIELKAGKTRLRTKAIRYGYAESEERVATFTVT